MDERSTTPRARVPLGATKPPRVTPTRKPSIDKFPKDPAEWRAFAALSAADRAAVYLRSIRAMMLFFTVLTILGIVAGVILGVVGINAVDQNATTTPNPFG